MSAIREALAGPGFARLLRQARSRLEREPDALPAGRISMGDPSDAERSAIQGLLGRRIESARVAVALAELDEALLAGTGAGLRAWLEQVHGRPLRDRPREVEAGRARRQGVIEELRGHEHRGEPWFAGWVQEVEEELDRLLAADALAALRTAAAVLGALPVDGEAMPVFASRAAGGTKALRGTRAARLALRGLARRAGVPVPETPLEERALWERFGVLPDDLSVTVLVLNLPAIGAGLVDDHLRAFRGIPVRLTLHQLMQHSPRLDPARTVFVCENPAIVRMAAERLGAHSAPLVATEGHANSAFWRLLSLLGDDVRARADFDADGLSIAGKVLELRGRPWRFDAATYRAFVGDNAPLPELLPDTPWDPALGAAMRGGVRVEEEELLALLLDDLRGG